MIQTNDHNSSYPIENEYSEYFALAQHVTEMLDELLRQFNERHRKLFDLPACQRIFLFILTRSIKTYASIVILCRQGYGQDVAILLRGLLENLITARYILADPASANILAERFVAYKWIIFKRSIPEQELEIKKAPRGNKQEFFKRKSMVMLRVDEFKKKFNVTSDRALLTWSGKTVRDMAKAVDADLLAEYESTFRQCSKFLHPCILGDQEYMIQDNKNLIFSSLPSPLGVLIHLKLAIKYFIQFAFLTDAQFQLERRLEIEVLKRSFDGLETPVKNHGNGPSPTPSPRSGIPLRECTIVFELGKSAS